MCRSSARANLGDILETTDFLPGFLADGLIAWLLSAKPASNQRSRGIVVATMRVLCRDLREAVDRELTALMEKLVANIIRAQRSCTYLRQRERAGDELGIKVQRANLEEALACVAKTTVPCFGTATAKQIRTDITEFSGMTTRLLPHPGTFLAMAQQRCQLSLRHPNVCTVTHLVSNFTELRVPGRSVCVYARTKARVEHMIIYTTQFLQTAGNGSIRDNFDLARAMLRLRGVFFPCTNQEVLAAFRAPLPPSPPPPSPPPSLFVEKHPHLDPFVSVEGLLELSPQEAARARAAVALEKRLAHERKCRIEAIERENMAAVIDEHIRDSKFFPGISCLEDLGKSCVGMEKCIRVMISKLQPGHLSPIDSKPVRNALATARSFLCGMPAVQKKFVGGVCSSEAYDFVSGMHVGHYSSPSTGGQGSPWVWPSWHNGLYLCSLEWMQTLPLVPRVTPAPGPRAPGPLARAADVALRFFDSLGGAQLERASQTPNGLVPRYRLEADGEVVEFDPGWIDDWEECREMQLGIQRLVRDSGLDSANEGVPPLSKEDFKDYHRLFNAHKTDWFASAHRIARGEKGRFKSADAHNYVHWIEAVFCMLVVDPATRCGALSVVGLHTERLLSHFIARGTERGHRP